MTSYDAPLGSLTPINTSFVALRKSAAPPRKDVNALFSYAGSDESCLTCFVVLHVHRDRADGYFADGRSFSFTGSLLSSHEDGDYHVTDPRYPQVEMRWSCPHDAAAVLATYPELYTFSVAGKDTSYSATQLNYTFVLTDSHGVREYGHVTTCVNGDVMVALSPYPWCNFFYRLAALYACNGELHGKHMIETLARSPTPPSGAEFVTPVHLPIVFRRPYDRLCSFIDTSPHVLLTTCFPDTDVLLGILANLLLEKHVLVVGPSFTMVSLVVMSLQALIAPFDWVHILVPILPSCLIDLLAAPPPYLVGILTSQLPLLRRVAMERVVMVYLDEDDVCEGVRHVQEEDVDVDVDVDVLPCSSRWSALRVGLRLLQMRAARAQTSHDVCSLFLSYYAILFGRAVRRARLCRHHSAWMAVEQQHRHEQSRQEDEAQTHCSTEVEAEPDKQSNDFYAKLMQTQSFHILTDVVRRALTATDDGEAWLDNEFIVAVVRGHRSEYARHYAILRRAEKRGGGYVARYSHCFGSRQDFTSWTAAVHGFGGHVLSVVRMMGESVCGRWCHHALGVVRGAEEDEVQGEGEGDGWGRRGLRWLPRWCRRGGSEEACAQDEAPVIVPMTGMQSSDARDGGGGSCACRAWSVHDRDVVSPYAMQYEDERHALGESSDSLSMVSTNPDSPL